MIQKNNLLLKNYSSYSEAYQLILHESDNKNAISDYYVQMIEKFSSKKINTILEIHPLNEVSLQINLRKEGFEVTSVSLDLGTSAIAGNKDGEHFIIGDFNFPSLKKTFDAVIITQGCFGNFLSEDKCKEFLTAILNQLNTQPSLLLLEFWHLPGVEKSLTAKKGHKDWETINSANEGSIIRLTNSKLQLATSVLSVDIHYIIENNNEVKKFNESHMWRLYTLTELELLLNNVGFHLVKNFNFLTFDDPEFNSFRLLGVFESK